jgi:hypothetical protein
MGQSVFTYLSKSELQLFWMYLKATLELMVVRGMLFHTLTAS